MSTYTQDNAQCFVFTFKEGLLSPMAHDLVSGGTLQHRRGRVSRLPHGDVRHLVAQRGTPMKDGKEKTPRVERLRQGEDAGKIAMTSFAQRQA